MRISPNCCSTLLFARWRDETLLGDGTPGGVAPDQPGSVGDAGDRVVQQIGSVAIAQVYATGGRTAARGRGAAERGRDSSRHWWLSKRPHRMLAPVAGEYAPGGPWLLPGQQRCDLSSAGAMFESATINMEWQAVPLHFLGQRWPASTSRQADSHGR